MTSHDVVNRVRRITGERRVGHAGTLDPLATGVLIVLVGPATRLAAYLTSAEKSYEAASSSAPRLTPTTPTAASRSPPRFPMRCATRSPHPGWSRPSSAPRTGPAGLLGDQAGGVTAYEAARKGEALELEPRTIEVKAARLLGVEVEPPSWDVEFAVSKGTYIRALARDLGRACESAAHLGALRRTRSGQSDSPDTTPSRSSSPTYLTALFTDPDSALGLPVLEVDDSAGVMRSATGGHSRSVPNASPKARRSVMHDGRLIAVYAASEGMPSH